MLSGVGKMISNGPNHYGLEGAVTWIDVMDSDRNRLECISGHEVVVNLTGR
jgi:hypothetical protein